jgi:hypothetical protein
VKSYASERYNHLDIQINEERYENKERDKIKRDRGPKNDPRDEQKCRQMGETPNTNINKDSGRDKMRHDNRNNRGLEKVEDVKPKSRNGPEQESPRAKVEKALRSERAKEDRGKDRTRDLGEDGQEKATPSKIGGECRGTESSRKREGAETRHEGRKIRTNDRNKS